MEYNGWTNYATWCINLWLNNDRGLYDDIYDEIQYLVEEGMQKAEIVNHLKDYIISLIDEINPLNDKANMFSDILTNALNEADYDMIAENFVDSLYDTIINSID